VATIVAFHAHPDDEVLLTGGDDRPAGGRGPPGDMGEMHEYGLPRSVITHRVDVRRYAAQKRAALAAHRTPVSGRGRGARLLRVLLRSPLPVFRVVCGTEWFAEPGGRTGELVARDQAAGPGPTELA